MDEVCRLRVSLREGLERVLRACTLSKAEEQAGTTKGTTTPTVKSAVLYRDTPAVGLGRAGGTVGGCSRVGVPPSGTGDLFPARINQEIKEGRKDAGMRGFRRNS